MKHLQGLPVALLLNDPLRKHGETLNRREEGKRTEIEAVARIAENPAHKRGVEQRRLSGVAARAHRRSNKSAVLDNDCP